jgi:hypothetical protein
LVVRQSLLVGAVAGAGVGGGSGSAEAGDFGASEVASDSFLIAMAGSTSRCAVWILSALLP